MSFLFLMLVLGLPQPKAVPPGPPPPFYTMYSYTAYTVYDFTTDEPPTKVLGVGGTLTLRADGTYDKRLSLLLGDSGPRFFSQRGRFTTKDDSIFFSFTDKNGADVQRGTFNYQSDKQKLTITIAGYPPGNKGVYELVATNALAPATAPAPRR